MSTAISNITPIGGITVPTGDTTLPTGSGTPPTGDIIPSAGTVRAEFAPRVAGRYPGEEASRGDTDQWIPRAGVRSRTVVSAHRSVVDRRPRDMRPGSGFAVYDSDAKTFVARRACVVDPMRRVERAQIGFAALAIAALLTALVVVGLIVVAHMRAGDWGSAPGGSTPTVVDGTGGAGAVRVG
ncbi:hypothetical protein ACL02S_04900 [Nocardia sp. 004]|uniref:hypothetical protein n=1 Tax=Nocardia sp. 004 TaxID=3385978 RepID=UPI00399F9686